MGRPRMIIVIRHAQSEGNQNRQIHQTIPDHRVKLTPEGWTQAHEAGRRLRSMLRPEDTLQIYTSPYRRTRETTEGILRSLTSDEPEPSPFKREAIKIWEEPRLREQDFGNFQPDSAAMERMWKERADYGHFFFRIPNGESAADAYDRVSGFNESLWRSFMEKDFPSVCVLVTHGLMTRVFLMKWYHWSVEYFEDLRNVNHCEFVVMTRPEAGGKYILKNELRTWSELHKRTAAEKGQPPRDRALSIPTRKRPGDCPDDCGHDHDEAIKRQKRPSVDNSSKSHAADNKVSSQPQLTVTKPPAQQQPLQHHFTAAHHQAPSRSPNRAEEDSEAFPSLSKIATADSSYEGDSMTPGINNTAFAFSQRLFAHQQHEPRLIPHYMEAGRDFGGSFSGAATPSGHGSPTSSRAASVDYGFPNTATAGGGARLWQRGSVGEDGRKTWAERNGSSGETGNGEREREEARADALGDQEVVEDEADEGKGKGAEGQQQEQEWEKAQVEEERREDDLGGAEEVCRAKAGEEAEGVVGVGRTEVGEKVLGTGKGKG